MKLAIASIFSFTGIQLFAQNLIVNPSAESAVSTGWTIVNAGTSCFTGSNWRMPGNQNGYPDAQAGSAFFNPGCGGSGGGATYELYQDIAVGASNHAGVDAGQYSVTFSGWIQTYDQTPPDQARMILEFRNASNTVLSSYNTGVVTSTSVWTRYNATRVAPANTRSMRIRLIGISNTGGAIDAYFDNLSLTALNLLPVNFVSFTSKAEGNSSALYWETSHEVNNKGFHIQRSATGNDWENISFVKASGEAGKGKYRFVDNSPLAGTNFYRLAQEDVDGKLTYSKTSSVSFSTQSKIRLYPNPAHDVLQVQGGAASAVFRILNEDGRAVLQTQKSRSINISSLPTGIYYLTVESDGNKETLKFVKK